ncbi:MAG TPA: hypothetical protein VH985_11450 [Candidatus Binatia bacterium]|jgi:hypothetical protein
MSRKSTKSTPRKKAGKPVDTSWHPRFIEILSQSCNVTLACKGAGVDRVTAYNHKRDLPDFAAAWEDAKEGAIEILEAEAWQRARKQSDLLMIFLLKAHKPEKYRERTEVDLTSSGKPLIEPLIAALEKAYGNSKQQPTAMRD